MLPYTFLSTKPRGTWGGNPEPLCQRKCITEGHKLQFKGFTVPSHTHTRHTTTYTHSREALLLLSWQTLWSVLRTHCSCCHCWNTAVTERLSVTTGDWRLATGKYVTASLGFTSHPYTWFSLACMIQLKMFVVYKHGHTWQRPRLKLMKSNRVKLRLDSVHKPNLNFGLVVRETGWSPPCGWLLHRDSTDCEFYDNHIQKQIATSSSIWCQRGILSPTAQISISLENRHTHTQTHTASLHKTSNIDKVAF